MMEIVRKHSPGSRKEGDELRLEDLRPGMEVSPSLTLYEELGRGGFSRVFKAWHSIHRKFYAMKIFRQNASVEYAVNEFNALERLRHENIVRYEFADKTVPGGLIYILMELLDGENLKRYTAGDQWLPVGEVGKMAVQILRALEYMQRFEPPVYHRDIKPGNIVWCKHQVYKLIDFNVSTAGDGRPVGGTLAYMPPDMMTDGRLTGWDCSADTFSLGVALYELLSHGYPWLDRAGVPNVHRYPIDIREYNGSVAADVAEFLSKAVTTDRAGRFASAGEMLEALLRTSLCREAGIPASGSMSAGGVSRPGFDGGELRSGSGTDGLSDFGVGGSSGSGGNGGSSLSGGDGSRSVHGDGGGGSSLSGSGGVLRAEYVEPTYEMLVGGSGMPAQLGILGEVSVNGSKVAVDMDGGNIVSVFGVHGSGLKHTVGVLAEMSLAQFSKVSKLPSPKTGMIFHYADREDAAPDYVSMIRPNDDIGSLVRLKAVYGVEPASLQDVVLLVPESSVEVRRREFPDLVVRPLLFDERELSAKAWSFLLGASSRDAVYNRELKRIMRAARRSLGDSGLVDDQTARSALEGLSDDGAARRSLGIKGFEDGVAGAAALSDAQKEKALQKLEFAAGFVRNGDSLRALLRPGRLIIVDLRDELIEREDVLGLFMALICIFSDSVGPSGSGLGGFVVFDEAQKYMYDVGLVSSVREALREVRRKGLSVILESGDPTGLPTEIIELSSIVIMHRFSSPSWFRHIQRAIAPFGALTAMDMASLRPDEAYLWAGRSTSGSVAANPLRINVRPQVTHPAGQ